MSQAPGPRPTQALKTIQLSEEQYQAFLNTIQKAQPQQPCVPQPLGQQPAPPQPLLQQTMQMQPQPGSYLYPPQPYFNQGEFVSDSEDENLDIRELDNSSEDFEFQIIRYFVKEIILHRAALTDCLKILRATRDSSYSNRILYNDLKQKYKTAVSDILENYPSAKTKFMQMQKLIHRPKETENDSVEHRIYSIKGIMYRKIEEKETLLKNFVLIIPCKIMPFILDAVAWNINETKFKPLLQGFQSSFASPSVEHCIQSFIKNRELK